MRWKLNLSPSRVLVLGFAGVIFAGSLLLSIPQATAAGKTTPYIDALFTATSAVCVTGLVVVETGRHWSILGQLVTIVLIQVGGLGIMTMSTLFALIIGKRISLRERLLIQEAAGLSRMAGVVRLVKAILQVTLVAEGAGALLLTARFARDMPLAKAAYFGVYHSVSAFCNAGFDLFGTSFMGYVGDWTVNLVVTSLIIVGGIGFTVIVELWETRLGRRGRLSLHSRTALKVTAWLLCAGTVLMYLFERYNPATLAPLPPHARLLAAYFHAVTPRTAGFNTIATGKMTLPALVVTMVLMFIGASPGGTGGGIKTTTIATVVSMVGSILRGKQDVEMGDKRLARDVVDRALAIAALSLGLLVVVTVLLSATQKALLVGMMFEATSAFGTVGLSMGITPTLTTGGKLFIMMTMFAGRVGPLTLAMAIAQRAHVAPVRLPEDRLLVG
jgi:trk system potassium uptake protein TrkH